MKIEEILEPSSPSPIPIRDMCQGVLYKIESGTDDKYIGEVVVYNRYTDFMTILRDNSLGWYGETHPIIRVKRLPKGTRVTLVQE